MSGVQHNYWFVITVIKSFNQNSLNISKKMYTHVTAIWLFVNYKTKFKEAGFLN